MEVRCNVVWVCVVNCEAMESGALPPNWVQHSSGGTVYYYNSITRESTYQRPLPEVPVVAPVAEQGGRDAQWTEEPRPHVQLVEQNTCYWRS